MRRSEPKPSSEGKRTPAEACEQAAELYRSIAEGEGDGHARGTARLLAEAAARCRERRDDAPSGAGSVAMTRRAPAPVEKPSASKFARLIRASTAALAALRRAGISEGRDELEAALAPFRAGSPRPTTPPAMPLKRRGRPPGRKGIVFGREHDRISKHDDPAPPHGLDLDPPSEPGDFDDLDVAGEEDLP